MLLGDPVQILVMALLLLPGMLLGLVLHEWAHAMVAVARGDQTPRVDGRLSLNPRHHLDPLGTIAFLLIRFGWAKPVRINPARMGHRFDPALVAVAGPLTNVVLAVVLSIPIKLILAGNSGLFDTGVGGQPLITAFRVLIWAFYVNIVLAVFNILPIPPLDGYNLVSTLLRRRFPRFFFQVDANRQLILLGLVVILFLAGTRVFLTAYAWVATAVGVPYYPY
jgi:Zn-dependent protease